MREKEGKEKREELGLGVPCWQERTLISATYECLSRETSRTDVSFPLKD